jgi:hypothetical protein
MEKKINISRISTIRSARGVTPPSGFLEGRTPMKNSWHLAHLKDAMEKKITEKIAALPPDANYFSLEFFPPKTRCYHRHPK